MFLFSITADVTMMNNVISIYVAIAISICYLPSSIQQPQPTYTSGSPQYQTRPYNQQFNFNPLVEQQCSNTNPSLIQPSDIDDVRVFLINNGARKKI